MKNTTKRFNGIMIEKLNEGSTSDVKWEVHDTDGGFKIIRAGLRTGEDVKYLYSSISVDRNNPIDIKNMDDVRSNMFLKRSKKNNTVLYDRKLDNSEDEHDVYIAYNVPKNRKFARISNILLICNQPNDIILFNCKFNKFGTQFAGLLRIKTSANAEFMINLSDGSKDVYKLSPDKVIHTPDSESLPEDTIYEDLDHITMMSSYNVPSQVTFDSPNEAKNNIVNPLVRGVKYLYRYNTIFVCESPEQVDYTMSCIDINEISDIPPEELDPTYEEVIRYFKGIRDASMDRFGTEINNLYTTICTYDQLALMVDIGDISDYCDSNLASYVVIHEDPTELNHIYLTLKDKMVNELGIAEDKIFAM